MALPLTQIIMVKSEFLNSQSTIRTRPEVGPVSESQMHLTSQDLKNLLHTLAAVKAHSTAQLPSVDSVVYMHKIPRNVLFSTVTANSG